MTAPLFPDEPGPGAFAPLAERMRPRTLAEVVGQTALLGEDGFLARAIAARRLPSILLWGPPGSGKTTLARLLARATGGHFFALSAVTSGVKDVRDVVEKARRVRARGAPALLFIDEIHRFHRGQQDALLPHVEDGTITLVGATTENPAHAIVAPLVSRCRVLVLQPLAAEDVVVLLRRALGDAERGLGERTLEADDATLSAIATEADGDARRALTTLEIAAAIVDSASRDQITPDDVRLAAQERLLRADRDGDQHYDLASAFIKSLRGSDADAALYYLARMIESGEDPRFLARRMVIFASEDIGLADARALLVAVAAAEAFDRVGLPEGSLALAQAALHLATAPKSNSVIVARDRAFELARARGNAPIPPEIRDANAPLSRSQGHGAGYRYPHDEPGHHAPVAYLPLDLRGERIFEPSEEGDEREIALRVRAWRERVLRGR